MPCNFIPPTGTLYFIQCSLTKRIKIGFSEDIKKRFKYLQAMSATDLSILLVVSPFSRCDEGSIHRKFLADRLHGEWFSCTPELLKFIEQMKTYPLETLAEVQRCEVQEYKRKELMLHYDPD